MGGWLSRLTIRSRAKLAEYCPQPARYEGLPTSAAGGGADVDHGAISGLAGIVGVVIAIAG
jgi:hypothetical protein